MLITSAVTNKDNKEVVFTLACESWSQYQSEKLRQKHNLAQWHDCDKSATTHSDTQFIFVSVYCTTASLCIDIVVDVKMNKQNNKKNLKNKR